MTLADIAYPDPRCSRFFFSLNLSQHSQRATSDVDHLRQIDSVAWPHAQSPQAMTLACGTQA